MEDCEFESNNSSGLEPLKFVNLGAAMSDLLQLVAKD